MRRPSSAWRPALLCLPAVTLLVSFFVAPLLLLGRVSLYKGGGRSGFGLGGSPGRWREFYPSTPPESLGLPPGVGILVFDGVRGHALDPATLQRLLGPDWRSQFTE